MVITAHPQQQPRQWRHDDYDDQYDDDDQYDADDDDVDQYDDGDDDDSSPSTSTMTVAEAGRPTPLVAVHVYSPDYHHLDDYDDIHDDNLDGADDHYGEHHGNDDWPTLLATEHVYSPDVVFIKLVQ